jgi:arabinofuranosyltransferase
MQCRKPRRSQPGKRPAGAPVRVESSRRIQIFVALLAVATVLGYVAHAASFRHYVNDDAYITFRYSRFLTLGRGPYFNIGEHVEGYTNPLFVLLMVPIIAFGGEAAASIGAKTIGVLCGGLSLVAAFILFLRLNGRAANDDTRYWLGGVLTVGLAAVSPSYAINSMSGLETTLFGLCITAGVLLGTIGAQRGTWCGAGIAFAAGVLTRPEGIAVFAVYWCAQGVSSLVTGTLASLRRQLLIDAAIVVVVFAGHLAFRWLAYDGEWLPNTYYAKAGGFWAFDAWPYVRDGIVTPFGSALGLVIAVAGYLLRGPDLRWIFPVLATALAGVVLPFVTGTDWMPGQRLLMPFLPLAAALIATGWQVVARRVIRQSAWLGFSVALVLLPALWLTQASSGAALRSDTLVRARGYENGHTALADWLRSTTARPGDTVALMDTGIVGYRCIDQRILDITGLTDRFIARSPGGFLDKVYDPGYVFDQKPRFIVLVLKQLGDSDEEPKEFGLSTWTLIERRMIRHPDFPRWYRKPPTAASTGEHWLDRMAHFLGASRVFLHNYPGAYYLLAVYERQEKPNT